MSATSKDLRRPSFYLRLIGTVLTVLLLVYLLHEQGWNEIGSAIASIGLARLGLALLLVFLSRMAVVSRWHVLLRTGGLDISYYQSARLTFGGLFASNFLPTTIGGDIVRLAGAVQLKYDSAICTASLVADRLVGMLGMALALPFGFSGWVLIEKLIHRGSQPNAVLGVLLIASENRYQRWSNRLVLFTRNTLDVIKLWLQNPRSIFLALVITWIHMICLFYSISILLRGLNDPMNFWLIAGLWSLVYFITLIPISINGYGLQEVSMAMIFAGAGGISHPNSLTVALVIRTLTMLASLPGAFFVPGILSGERKKTQSNGTHA